MLSTSKMPVFAGVEHKKKEVELNLPQYIHLAQLVHIHRLNIDQARSTVFYVQVRLKTG
jgi:hypothetical protein